MAIDGILMRGLLIEFRQELLNARVNRIFQPEPNTLIIHFRKLSGHLSLLISADPMHPRLHLTSTAPANPLTPPVFCMVMRKHLIPSRVLHIEQPGLERVIRFTFETYDEVGDRTCRHLVVEVMGRHSNVVLIDDHGTILDAIRRVGESRNRYRQLLPQSAYIAPPSQNKACPLTADETQIAFNLRHTPPNTPLFRSLMQDYDGIGPLAGREIIHRAGIHAETFRSDIDEAQIGAVAKSFKTLTGDLQARQFEPTIVKNAETDVEKEVWIFDPRHLVGSRRRAESVSQALDLYYVRQETRQAMDRAQSDLIRVIEGELKRLYNKMELQTAALKQAEGAEALRMAGELLTANLWQVRQGMDAIEVDNYYGEPGERMVIELDRTVSPADNAQAYFRRYQRSKNTVRSMTEQLGHTTDEINYLESLENAIAVADEVEDLEAVRQELMEAGYVRSDRQRTQGQRDAQKRRQPTPPRRFSTEDDFEVWVGRNNRQNDEITLRRANPDDLWFHTKDIPGTHVILRADGRDVTDEAITEAAILAAYYSKARQGSQVPVDYVACRHVRKPRGARPGFVIYDHHRTVYVTPAADLIDKIAGRPLN